MKKFNWYLKNEEEIIKYECIFDEEELKKLKLKVQCACSIFRPEEFVGTRLPEYLDKSWEIRDVTSVPTGDYLDGDFGDCWGYVYLYSYNRAHTPYLVDIIDDLIKEDYSKIVDLYLKRGINDNILQAEVDACVLELKAIKEQNIDEKIKKLDELKQLMKTVAINSSKESVAPYYDNLINMFQLKRLGNVSVEEFNKMIKFFDLNIDDLIIIDNKNLCMNLGSKVKEM